MKATPILQLSVAVIAFAGTAATARAAAYSGSAHDSIDYPSGTAITTGTALNGGGGWNSAGDNSANTAAWNFSGTGSGFSVGSGTLSYGGLLTGGNKAVGTGASGNSNIGRLFAQTIDSGTFYFSFLMQKTVDTERTLNVSFFSTPTGTGTPNERFAIGQIGGGANDSDGNFALLISNSGAGTNGLRLASSPLALGLNTTHLVVGRLDFNVNGNEDLLSIYIDPSLASEPGSAYMTASVDFQTVMGFRMFAGNSAAPFSPAAQGEFDEFNFGTSWASVTPAPEPSSLSLLTLGGLLFAWNRRKQ